MQEQVLLVVEDEALIAVELEEIAAGAGFKVISARASYEATSLLASAQVDFVLLDLVLNGQPCFPLARRLLASGIRFAFCSGWSGGQLPVDLKSIPLIRKPFFEDEVRNVIALSLAGPVSDPGPVVSVR
jgi:CheY-like chemotaxis protein